MCDERREPSYTLHVGSMLWRRVSQQAPESILGIENGPVCHLGPITVCLDRLMGSWEAKLQQVGQGDPVGSNQVQTSGLGSHTPKI
jgi:hypothetical protein